MTIGSSRGRVVAACFASALALFTAPRAFAAAGGVIAWGCSGATDHRQCNVPAAARSGVVGVAAMGVLSLAVKRDGSVVGWGCDGGKCDLLPVPAVRGVTAVAAGASRLLFLTSAGRVTAWCPDLTGIQGCPVPPAAESGVVAISASQDNLANLALKRDGSVVAWGCGPPFLDFGQCAVPTTAQTGVKAVADGGYHSLAL